MTGKSEAKPIVWRAAADQIAHAHRLAPGETRTLCGIPRTDVRLSWPPVAKCPDCLSAAGQRGVAA